ncbi:3'-5' exonuclease [Marinomonas ostreistagni]|uniref:3'-5' exonuclease n=1 Tax=Marinomonas ostreistagni TaxID=359209 RepID=UPI00194E491E|nr:3'-5' exonuclease [Marinomonas ostreistagni]MBM6551819.1 3'-5' exonuclease domain-containing protein 2 [Marinomonas ostreistagni]
MQRPSKEQINQLPTYKGLALADIAVIETEEEADEALAVLRQQTHVGYDTESKPIFQKGEVSPGPTLIQLATLTQGFLFPTRFAPALAAAGEILANPQIQKVGFGLKDDNRELRGKLGISIVNTEDLAKTLKRLAGEKNDIGARAGVAMVLKARLGKGAQKSNWGAYPLTQSQILYAANDAHGAICIHHKLQE